jgi:hypothetical protein
VVHAPEPLKDDPGTSVSDSVATGACGSEGPCGPEGSATPVAARPRRLEPAEAATPPADAPRPIGMDRLRALREAIRNGAYPTSADVVGGLVRMFGEPDAVPGAEDEVP